MVALVACMALLPKAGQAAEEKANTVQLLFVQNAKEVTFDSGKMTLKGVSPVTVFFSDRPDRIAGHLATAEMIPLWSEGKDSFLSDPPIGTLSIFGDGKVTEVVVVLRNPQLQGDDLTYDVRVLQGPVPEKGGLCSLFIDVVGMPLTPLSYAGAGHGADGRR